MPLWRKGSPQPSQMQKPERLVVEASWIPVAQPFHSRIIDLRMWSPNLAYVRKKEPQAVQVKGRKGKGGRIGFEGEGRWIGRVAGVGGLAWEGRGVDMAISKRLAGIREEVG